MDGERSKAPRGGQEGGRVGRQLGPQPLHTHTPRPPPQPPTCSHLGAGQPLPPALHPRPSRPLHLHPWDQQQSQREGSIWKAGGLGQSSSWRAGGGDVGGAKGLTGRGWALGAQLHRSWWGPRRDRARHTAEIRRGWAGLGGPRCQEAPGWVGAQGGGVSPAASAALGASASLFLGINIYRFIRRLPYTLGCLPPSKNRADSPTPILPFPTRAGDKGDQVRLVPHRPAGENLVSRSLVAGPEAG